VSRVADAIERLLRSPALACRPRGSAAGDRGLRILAAGLTTSLDRGSAPHRPSPNSPLMSSISNTWSTTHLGSASSTFMCPACGPDGWIAYLTLTPFSISLSASYFSGCCARGRPGRSRPMITVSAFSIRKAACLASRSAPGAAQPFRSPPRPSRQSRRGSRCKNERSSPCT